MAEYGHPFPYLAELIRDGELRCFVAYHHATTDTPDAWCGADQVARALLALHHAAAGHPEQPVDADTIAEHIMLIRHAPLAATHPAGALGRKHRALARRIHKRER